MKTKGTTTPKKAPAARRKQPSKAKAKIMLTTLAVGAAGILGYLGWTYYKKRKAARGNADADLNRILQPAATTSLYTTATPPRTDTIMPPPVAASSTRSTSNTAKSATTATASIFPLKKGSKNNQVKALQQALIAKYGAAILPKYGADGDFGTETAAALKKAGLPATIDDSTYYVIVQGSGSATDKTTLATKLLTAADRRDFAGALGLLKQLNTKEDYRQVSDLFSQQRLRGVRQTLVTGLLDSFSTDSQKQQIRYEFIRMGLKYDGSKWSLDGFDGRPVVTIEPTNVWINATESVNVPAMMVLGAEVSRKLDYTLFENNNRYFLVATRAIKYL